MVTAVVIGLGAHGATWDPARAAIYGAVMGLMAGLVAWVDRTARFTPRLVLALAAWAGLHMAGGMIRTEAPDVVLYNAWLLRPVLRVDQAIHFYAYAVVAVAASQALRRFAVPVSVAVLVAIGLGALNEVVEFVSTGGVDRTQVGGFANMGWDLVFNAAGATAAGLWLRGTRGRPGADQASTRASSEASSSEMILLRRST